MWKSQDKFFVLTLVLIASAIFYFLGPILTPFLTGALLAYLANPAVERLMRFKWPRLVCVILVFIIFALIVITLTLLLIPFIQTQVVAFLESIPDILAWGQAHLAPWLQQHFGISETIFDIESIKSLLVKNLSKATTVANTVVATTVHSSLKIIEWLTNLLIIPIVMFYLLCDWNKLLFGIQNLIPKRYRPTVIHLSKESDAVLSAFLRGQLLVMLALGIIYAIGLSLIGLKTGFLIGLMAGLLSVVPYLGFIVGILVAAVAALVQFNSVSSLALVGAVFLTGQILESAFLTPKLMGDQIGLHPVAVIFAILAGGSLFGFTGVLLALPAAAVIMVLLRYANKRYHHSELYNRP